MNTRPVLQDIDQGKITQVYTELRREAASGGLAIAVRHIESIIRMAEASARMHLRDNVRNDDVDLAISVLLRSVIDSQKYAVKRSMEQKFKKYMVHSADTNQLLDFELRRLYSVASHMHTMHYGAEPPMPPAVFLEEFEAHARQLSVSDLSAYYASTTFTGDSAAQYTFRKAKDVQGRDVVVRAVDEEAFNAYVERKNAAHDTAGGVEETAH
eukprot:scaffold94738_cov33-Tisochrysis_lutea.AAC.1